VKIRRVGTISMGISLIIFGILILISQFNEISGIELAVKFWPSILILLGGEILWYSYKARKDNDIIIKYDIFSIFIILVILFVNIVLYGFIEIGIMDYFKQRIMEDLQQYNNLSFYTLLG